MIRKENSGNALQCVVMGHSRPQRLHRPGMLFVLFTHNKNPCTESSTAAKNICPLFITFNEIAGQTSACLCPGFEVIKYEIQ